jgi:single-strand DNA-binding protein
MSNIRNYVQLLGFVGNDPEVRTTTTDRKVANFRIATTESYKDQSGQWQNETTWHSISCWEALADRVVRQIKKGSYVILTGKLVYRKYTDSNSIERTSVEIRMDSFVLLDRQKNDSENQPDEAGVAPNDDLPF